jgi:Omp85 superfamily domain
VKPLAGAKARAALASWVFASWLVGSSAHAGYTLIPIPELIVDPNEGVTYGLLPVLMLTDRNGRLEHMIADDLRYNRTTGWFPGFRLFGYPTAQSTYYLVARQSTKIDQEYEALYQDDGLAGGGLRVLADVGFLRDSLRRFFGFGNGSDSHDETNYTQRRFAVRFRLGYRPLASWEIAWQARFEDIGVSPGGVHGLPFTGDRFPDTFGLAGSTIHGESLQLAYDSRDSVMLPTRGALAAINAEIVDRTLGASSSYTRYGLDLRDFIPFGGRFVLALHGELDYVHHAAGAPFYELSSIGGQQSVRGYGEGRFVDANRSLASAELRTEVFRAVLFDVLMSGEVAPFVDAGRVFSSAADFPLEQLHVAGGLGFRAVIRPQVVGYVDIGYGSEGFAAFSGLDYPF